MSVCPKCNEKPDGCTCHPDLDEKIKRIIPNPWTGQGDARRVPYDKTDEWDSDHVPLPPDFGDGYDDPFGKDVGEEIVTRKPALSTKDTNPKDAVGVKKWRQFTTVPSTVLWELGVAMLEGARKYGRHNYRVAGVRGSVYVDAAKGHLDCWWEGEDADPDSGLSHITKAIASLTVLRDAMIQERFVDDRPPRTKNLEKVKANLQAIVDRIFNDIPDAKDAFLEGDQNDDLP